MFAETWLSPTPDLNLYVPNEHFVTVFNNKLVLNIQMHGCDETKAITATPVITFIILVLGM
jgi:hypothetical protein